MWYPVFKILDWTDSSVSHLRCACHWVGPGITQVNATFPLWSARGTCLCSAFPPPAATQPRPLLFAAMEACDNQIRSAHASAANSECFWVFHPWASEVCLSPASWGGHFFKSRLTVPAFPGPEAALPSPQFWPCPFGWLHQVLHFHHLSASTTSWRDLEGNAFLFSPDLLCLLSGPILLPQFSRPPSPFSQSQNKKRSLLWLTTELDLSVFAVGKGDCFPQQHYQVCAWASRMCLLLTPHLECAEDPGTQQVFVYWRVSFLSS